MALVTCVIPNFNYARYLRGAIDSALAQTHKDLEVIVVDDGSTDGSADILRSYGGGIRAFVQHNQGVSAARNRGLKEARGQFIAVLDADDSWHATKIERQLALMRTPDIGLVHCWVREVDAEGAPIREVRGGLRGWALADHAQLRTTVLGGGSAAVLRRECFAEFGGFDPSLSTSADWDMWRRVMGKYRIDLVEEALVDYRIHGAAMHRNVKLFEHDLLRVLESTFSDPAAASVRRHRRSAYAKAYGMLSAGYYLSGDSSRAVRNGIRSLVLSPRPLAQMLLRQLRKRLWDNGNYEQAPIGLALV
jgi:glycosyltransferase involved in cell wall biosynthesis